MVRIRYEWIQSVTYHNDLMAITRHLLWFVCSSTHYDSRRERGIMIILYIFRNGGWEVGLEI